MRNKTQHSAKLRLPAEGCEQDGECLPHPPAFSRNMHHAHRTASTLFFALAASTRWSSAESLPHTSLSVVERSLLTTAQDSFNGHDKGFEATTQWSGERLRASQGGARAPHLACTEYSRGGEAISRLQEFLSPEAVRPVVHSSADGACFFVTASHAEARALSNSEYFGLSSISPFPSALKVAPGVLEHGVIPDQATQSPGRLTTTHGQLMRMGNVEGLDVELSPGTLPAHSPRAGVFIAELLEGLMSTSIDLHAANVYSDPTAANVEHLTTPEGALREREWRKAAALVHELSVSGRTTPGDICSWDSISMHHAANDLLLVSGLNHILYTGSEEAWNTEEAEELRVACFMSFVSFLSGRIEVLRVAPRTSARLLNAVARALVQSATITATPLTAAGLDGTGEVIQVVDTGLDETSCFFIDDDGEEVPHGYYFEKVVFRKPLSAEVPTSSSTTSVLTTPFEEGDFSSYPDRRKVIQYINLINTDSVTPSGTVPTSGGGIVSYFSAADFQGDEEYGHGTHTAGSAAGSTLNTPAETATCSETTKVPGCVGSCIDVGGTSWGDDLLDHLSDEENIDVLCPMLGCDDETDQRCLSDDVGQTLAENGGMAQGAKIAFFDIFSANGGYGHLAGNGLWQPCLEAGCKVHSNSWGEEDPPCLVKAMDLKYDDFMYKNPENLLVFAAGNQGQTMDTRPCTINSPGIAKNVLAVGATASGATRLSSTNADGGVADGSNGYADVDTVAEFSSYGPTSDDRIKPEVLAPGDTVYSASSDGEDIHSCRVHANAGTSMSCPIVAGASAMIRQYFLDSSFYVADVTARGWCKDDGFPCEAFSPSSATVKALLINSANLMGYGSEPHSHRGFGRIHMEMGMPLGGEGSLALFVADQAALPELDSQEFFFDVDADAALDFRATLCWIDPPAHSISAKQLLNDLDLVVESPSGTMHTMWSSGVADTVNVNERVIIDAADVESGIWTVRVSTNELTTASQRYSLVVNGAIVYSSTDPFYSDLYSVAPTSSPSAASAGSPAGSSSSTSDGSSPRTLASVAPTSAPSGAGTGSAPTNDSAPTNPSSTGSIASAPVSLVAILVGAAVSTIAAACAA